MNQELSKIIGQIHLLSQSGHPVLQQVEVIGVSLDNKLIHLKNGRNKAWMEVQKFNAMSQGIIGKVEYRFFGLWRKITHLHIHI